MRFEFGLKLSVTVEQTYISLASAFKSPLSIIPCSSCHLILLYSHRKSQRFIISAKNFLVYVCIAVDDESVFFLILLSLAKILVICFIYICDLSNCWSFCLFRQQWSGLVMKWTLQRLNILLQTNREFPFSMSYVLLTFKLWVFFN